MSDIDRDPRWNGEAANVARQMDMTGDAFHAQDQMRRDLMQLQYDPHAQHEFIRMVNEYDHKGIGADIQVYRDPYGQEQWQITAPNYGGGYAPPPPREVPVPVPVPQPDPGEAILGGVVGGVIGGLIGGSLDHEHRRWR